MKRSSVVKFPNSLQLFKFCQKILSDLRGEKINDQEVGSILNFNPSDCSHWKRGEKNVKSVFALAKLAEALKIEPSLIHDLSSGHTSLEEAHYEYLESKNMARTYEQMNLFGNDEVQARRMAVVAFAKNLLKKADFNTTPLYLPEVFRFFPFITVQPTDLIDKLSRVLRSKPHHYIIQFRKGELKPQTRMSMTMDLAKILFEAERDQFPELGPVQPEALTFERILFACELLIPNSALSTEIAKLDSRKNVVAELSSLFWVPKSLIGFKLQDSVRSFSEQESSYAFTSTTATDRPVQHQL
jgi:hypothetical protein